jgi:hypothetical protein
MKPAEATQRASIVYGGFTRGNKAMAAVRNSSGLTERNEASCLSVWREKRILPGSLPE